MTPTAADQRVKIARWSLGKTYLVNALFCTVIAAMIWIALPASLNYGFLSNWVHAQAIGTIICSLVLLTNCSIDRYRILPDRLLLFLLPLIIVIGYFLGSSIARLLVDAPSMALDFSDDRQMMITMMALTVVVTVAITWFFTSQTTITELRINAAEESERAAQAHLSMLLAQIEPHMLFNTLANLRALIGDEPDKAREMLDSLIEFLRSTLQHSRTSTVALEQDFQILDSYLSLMAIRLGDRLRYSMVLPESLKRCSIPSLLLQPIVENAIKHGIEPAIDGGSVVIKAEKRNNRLVLMVEDTGKGLTQAMGADREPLLEDSVSGLGLANVRARCEALPGGKFDIVSPLPASNKGTAVTIELPLTFQDEQQSKLS